MSMIKQLSTLMAATLLAVSANTTSIEAPAEKPDQSEFVQVETKVEPAGTLLLIQADQSAQQVGESSAEKNNAHGVSCTRRYNANICH